MYYGDNYDRAKRKVAEMKGFYVHLVVYIFTNIFLFIINWITSPVYWWVIWPILGWGIGLAANWFSVFGEEKFLGKDWEKRKIQELMDRDDTFDNNFKNENNFQTDEEKTDEK